MAYQLVNKQESFLARLKGRTGAISDATHEEHVQLYAGYVEKANSLMKMRAEVLSAFVDCPEEKSVGRVRAHFIEACYCGAAVANHELYFNALGGPGGEPSGKIAALIDKSFGDFGAYLRQVKTLGLAAQGWVWTGLETSRGLLLNHLGDSENTFLVWGFKPVVALDVHEHAYVRDFGQDKPAYMAEFFRFIDWEAVNALLA